jgi:diacylglycerol kinase (ATP)
MVTMKSNKSFSIATRGQSFKYAFEGISSFFKTQPNAFIHLLFTVIVFIAIFFLNIPLHEIIILVLVIGFVWVAEIFNTVIESIMDHVSPDKHPSVKYIKDVSAAAVLVAALTAAVVGLLIFIPKFF